MKALISKTEPKETGYRVAQVVTDNSTFPVAEPDLFWVSCANDVVQDKFWYDPSDQTINAIPLYIPTAENNQVTAMAYLAETDWVNEPDVINPNINPHLLNQAEFLTFRSQVRAIAINPIAGNLTWPTEPIPQWSSV